MDTIGIQRSRHHNGQFSGNLTDQWLRHENIALHGLFYVFAVRIIVSVKNADAVRPDDISPLKIVHGTALVNDGLFFIRRHFRVG